MKIMVNYFILATEDFDEFSTTICQLLCEQFKIKDFQLFFDIQKSFFLYA
jgi:hypothetical protein